MSNIIACPSCGAPVTFVSAQSLLAVCGYCRASLIRRDLDVEQVGTMAALLEDITPIQLGAEGRWHGVHFAVVGRLQLRWEHGRWNEWYCAFDDGRGGWLGDAGGEYTVAFETPVAEPLPSRDGLRVGDAVTLGGVIYEVTDLREAEMIAGEGELPFRIASGWTTRTADLRTATARFATLDYSDETPRLYTGEVVELEVLGLRGLRELDRWR
jgi:hypothetical protein